MFMMLNATIHRWFAVCLLVVAAGAVAGSVQDQTAKVVPVMPITLEQAVTQVQEDIGGRVLAADTIRSRHGNKYRIKMLTANGRVRVIEVSSIPNPNPKPDAKGAKDNSKETD